MRCYKSDGIIARNQNLHYKEGRREDYRRESRKDDCGLEGYLGNRSRSQGSILATPEGNRALRILIHHAGAHGYSADGSSITMGWANDVAAINTTDACQAAMNALANMPLTIQFEQPEVIAVGVRIADGGVLANTDEVKKARAAGHTVAVSQVFSLGLPMTGQDLDRLKEFVPGGVYHRDGDPYGMAFSIFLQGKLATAVPWELVNDLKPKIRKAIV